MIFTSLFLLFNSHLLSSFFPWPQSPQSLSLVPKCFFEFHWIPPLPVSHLNWLWNCGTPRQTFVQLPVTSCLPQWSWNAAEQSWGEVKGEKMRRGRRARGVTERHPLVKECAGRTTQPSFLHFTVVQCTYCYYLPSLPSIPLILCRVPYSLQDNCFQKRDNGEEGLGMLPPYALRHSHLVNLTPDRETNGLDWNCWPTIDK